MKPEHVVRCYWVRGLVVNTTSTQPTRIHLALAAISCKNAIQHRLSEEYAHTEIDYLSRYVRKTEAENSMPLSAQLLATKQWLFRVEIMG